MKKFLWIVIGLVIFAIAGYGIAYLVIPVNSIELNEYTHTVDMLCDDAFIVRDETVYYSTSDGTVYNMVADGDRVSENHTICTTYNGDVSYETLKKLQTVDTKINDLKTRSANANLYKTDSSSIENEIALRMDEAISLSRSNSIEEIHEIREDINALRTEGSTNLTAKINALEIERINIEAEIPGTKTATVADRAGIFSSYIDGLESVLTPERIKEYNPDYIRSLTAQGISFTNGKNVVTGDPMCKVMNNHNWYVLGIVSEAEREKLDISKTPTIRFTNLSGSSVEGELVYVSDPDANGDSLCMYRMQTYLESAFSYRNIDIQIIFNEYSGYKIPTDAIHTGDSINEYYVYARQGSESYRCEIEILHSDMSEGFSIVRSTDNADNNLSSMDRLIVGER